MNTAADLEAEDQRVEAMAARQTAVRLALALNSYCNDGEWFEVLRDAKIIGEFLLGHPANGEAAFKTALTLSVRRTNAPDLDQLLICATRFATYLETGSHAA